MKPMLLTDANDIPKGKEWMYETKYDGFRCILTWEGETPTLKSRNDKELTHLFPEIIQFCSDIYERIQPYLPLRLDGELVYLRNDFQSEFSIVQTRGRMRSETSISDHVQAFPCHYIGFDILKLKDEDLTNLSLTKRKKALQKIFNATELPTSVNYKSNKRLQMLETFTNDEHLWNKITVHNGEGIIAKRKGSTWIEGTRTKQWLKIKNWRYVTVILTKYDESNGFFTGAVYKEGELTEIVTFLHGLEDEEIETLRTLFRTNGKQISRNMWELAPSICIQIACISFDGKHLREPRFHKFDFEMNAANCDWNQMLRQLLPIPESIAITHPDKPVWPQMEIRKEDYLYYLQNVASLMLPFLHNRHLTVIRYPHGVPGEKFYQKNAPDYLPDFIATSRLEDIDYILCNEIESLLWLGNQLALEFHIPFQTINTAKPTEIVFDLDPPSVEEFSIAVEAAIRMKAIFDKFELESFVKTSGGKGLQIYIPLPFNRHTYEDTRLFTKFVCDFLCEQEPDWFTTERLKKNRNNKLYLDYVQHQAGKTIVAPYSPRGNEHCFIATPLQWEEVDSSLKPSQFTIPVILERIHHQNDPFRDFFDVGEKQEFESVYRQLKDLLG
ncbi:DNA ligase D [Sporosarcina ureilytica]|uniref:DNA ligase (ATP) n=1 Tax=Sporosarcina ureilytica TaxID=298596 RepID=A0A1D8JIM6_9BACL|nr:DNA ligase D [Sporosarcina ureilytica]AOV08561.1 DNA ligase D [Sporosarcina ureilytica]